MGEVVSNANAHNEGGIMFFKKPEGELRKALKSNLALIFARYLLAV